MKAPKSKSVFGRSIFFVLVSVLATSANASRTFISAPVTWSSAVNIPTAWAAGSAAYFNKQFRISVKNISNVPQHVEVFAQLRSAGYTRNGSIDLSSSQLFFCGPACDTLGTLGSVPSGGSGEIAVPTSSYVTLDPVDTSSSDFSMFDFSVQYTGANPAGCYINFQGSLSFKVVISDDIGAVSASLSENSGCAGGCPMGTDPNTMASTAPVYLPLNGGRPF